VARPKWSVQLIVDPPDVSALSQHLLAALSRDVHGLLFGGGLTAEDEEPPWITIDVSADDWRSARVVAQHRVGLIYEAAGLRPRKLPVAWVAPRGPGADSSLRFMRESRDLLDEERYDLAVVAAQIHLEAHIDALVRHAVATNPSSLGDVVVLERQWSLTHSSGRKILEAILQVRLADFPRWKEYGGHVARRNRIIHGGHGVEAELARESVELIDEFWQWLNAALIPGAQRSPAARPARPQTKQMQLDRIRESQ
jgi:hypothetical protein